MRKIPGSAPFFIVGINRGLRGYWTGKFFSTNTADAVPFENQRIATNALLKARKTLAEQGGWAQAVKVKLGIVAHDADYGENPATRSQARMHRAYRAAVAADKKFARELKRQFGRNASVARYRVSMHNEYDARTAKAYRQFVRANDRNLKRVQMATYSPDHDVFRRNPDKSKRFVRGKYGLTTDPVGAQIKFVYGKRTFLGDVVGQYFDHVTGVIRLKVKHFNGEPWPLDPPAINVEILRDKNDEYERNPLRRTAKLRNRKKNPVSLLRSQVDRAGRAYSEFTGHPVKGARRVNVKNFRVGWPLGKLDGVMYSTVRDGKAEKYIHRFRSRSRPLLAVSSDGTQLGIVGGQFQVTEAGIEDS